MDAAHTGRMRTAANEKEAAGMGRGCRGRVPITNSGIRHTTGNSLSPPVSGNLFVCSHQDSDMSLDVVPVAFIGSAQNITNVL